MLIDTRVETRHLYLRSLTAADAGERYLSWLRNSLVNEFLEVRFERHSIESLQDFITQSRASQSELLLGIFERAGDRHLGNVQLRDINVHHKTAEVGILVGEKDVWGRGVGTEAIKAMIGLARDKLGMYKLYAGVYSRNVRSVKAFEKVGFVVEGVRRRHVIVGDVRDDVVILGCFL
jgi:RimJ/RimL family protein N-acetyltransferase